MRISVGKLIVKMHEHNFNNNRLAAKAKISRATVSNIKCGKSCSLDTLTKISKALGVEIHDILED